jgi:hypothetical protein
MNRKLRARERGRRRWYLEAPSPSSSPSAGVLGTSTRYSGGARLATASAPPGDVALGPMLARCVGPALRDGEMGALAHAAALETDTGAGVAGDGCSTAATP